MRSHKTVILAGSITVCTVVLITHSAVAYQGIVSCRDCQFTPPGVVGAIAQDPNQLQPAAVPVHDFARIQRERHRACVSGLNDLAEVVGRLEKLKTSDAITSAHLPTLQKSFKKLSKTVGANCF